MAERSYRQYCAVARGLDVVGERWTLLIVRDLLTGPKRYKDLLAGLPGIGTNLLAARLRDLEEHGLVQRRALPPPAGVSVYELTDLGRGLEPVVGALGRWGHQLLGSRRKDDFLSASAYLLAMRAVFHADAAAGLAETYELRVGNQVFEVRVADGRCTTREGQPANPDVVLTFDVETLSRLLDRELSPADALASGRAHATPDADALDRFVALFAIRPALAAATPD